MSTLQFRPLILGIITVICAIAIILIEIFVNAGPDGTFLLTLSFWVALIQGPIALVAAAEVSQGKWIKPVKKELMAFYPLILLLAGLFIFMIFKMDIYNWTHESHRWLRPDFFVGRNSILLALSFLLAHWFIRSSMKAKPYTGKIAILFIFSFIVTQSLVAFDWVMSLEYPWMSTMFAPIFFMESFYAGLAIAGIITAYLLKKQQGGKSAIQKVMQDSAVFMFGFALAWAGLYYGQFLVIWYGNIPWETSFFALRMDHSPFAEMMYLILILLFIIPFIMFIPRKIKVSPGWVTSISLLILLGLLVERVFYILPVVSIHYIGFIVEFVLFAALMVLYFFNRDTIVKSSAP